MLSGSTTTPTPEATVEPSIDPPPPGETGRELSIMETAQALEDAMRGTVPAVHFPRRPEVGDTLLVNIGEGQLRPVMVTAVSDSHEGVRVSGVVFCDPGDHTLPAFRGTPGISGRPDRMSPYGLVSFITEGWDVGQWRRRPSTNYTPSTGA